MGSNVKSNKVQKTSKFKILKASYKDAIVNQMNNLAKDKNTIFLGQGVVYPDKIYHTLDNVPKSQCIEMPIAENMQTGIAIGLALEGFRPVSIYQRMDFLLLASDQIINHLDKIEEMSGSQFKVPVLTRTIVGAKKPLDAGPQHTQDFTNLFKDNVRFDVIKLKTAKDINKYYKKAIKTDKPMMLIEERRLY